MQKKISLSQHILREILRTPKALSHIKHLFVLSYNLRSKIFGEIWIQFDFISFDEIKISFLLESLTFPLWSFSSVDFSGAPSYSKKWKTAAVKSQIMAFHDISPYLWLPLIVKEIQISESRPRQCKSKDNCI